MSIHIVTFRVHGSDVFEQPVEARFYWQAVRRALQFWGLSMAQVTLCRAEGWQS